MTGGCVLKQLPPPRNWHCLMTAGLVVDQSPLLLLLLLPPPPLKKRQAKKVLG